MKAGYNIALVLVRFLAVYFIITGVMGFFYIAVAAGLFFGAGVNRSVLDPALWFSVQSSIGNPIYVIAGVVVLYRSVPIARFVAKYCEE